jgi:hypothetical protein
MIADVTGLTLSPLGVRAADLPGCAKTKMAAQSGRLRVLIKVKRQKVNETGQGGSCGPQGSDPKGFPQPLRDIHNS